MTTPRNIESQIEIAAPVEAVWKALTDADELTRWFPLDARVKPGSGGSIWMSWRNEYQFDTPIEIWEENKHLRLVYVEATPPPKPGEPVPPFVIPFRVAVDYYIEGKGGSTIVRLVHSGFSRDASWDNQYDGTVRGWAFQLDGLKAYLEGHRGKSREVVYIRRAIPTIAVDEAWKRIVGEAGLFDFDNSRGSRRAAAYLKLPFGSRIAGLLHNLAPNREVWLKPNDPALPTLRVQIDDSFGKRDVTLWISTFGLAPERLQQLRDDLTSEMLRLFPESLDPADACAAGPGVARKPPE
ncbi:MAG: SRPBCC family protein [Phycisphaerae bacterium]